MILMKKIALFGGSFNPPHIGHKQLIELVRDSFPCDEIWLMPSGDRKDKTMHVESNHCLAMAHLLAEEVRTAFGPGIVISSIETERTIPTATINTLRELRSSFPDHEFHFIISSELVPDIRNHWEEGEELFNTTNFILIERQGSHSLYEVELPPLHTFLTPKSPITEISSTFLRGLSDEDHILRSSSKNIADYIIKNRLYSFK